MAKSKSKKKVDVAGTNVPRWNSNDSEIADIYRDDTTEDTDDMTRTPLTTEATTTGNIATFMTPLGPPMSRSPLRYQGYEHGAKQPNLCKKCKKLGYICPECPGTRKA